MIIQISGKNVVGKDIRKLVNVVPTRFVGMEMSISRAVPRFRLKEVSKLDYFSGYLRWIWTERSKHSFGSENDIGGRLSAVPLDPFLLVSVTSYNFSFTSVNKVLGNHAKEHFGMVK